MYTYLSPGLDPALPHTATAGMLLPKHILKLFKAPLFCLSPRRALLGVWSVLWMSYPRRRFLVLLRLLISTKMDVRDLCSCKLLTA